MSLKESPIVIDSTNGLTVSLETCADGKTIAVSFSFPESSELSPSVDIRYPMIQIIRARLQNHDMSTTSWFDSVEDKTNITYNGSRPHSLNFMLSTARDAVKAVANCTRQGASLNDAMDEVLSNELAQMPVDEKLISHRTVAETIRTTLQPFQHLVPKRDAMLLAEPLSRKLANEHPVWPRKAVQLKRMYGDIRDTLSAFITDQGTLTKVMVKMMGALEKTYERVGAVGREP